MRSGIVLFSQTRGQPEGTHLGGILALLLVNSTRPKGVINIIVLSLFSQPLEVTRLEGEAYQSSPVEQVPAPKAKSTSLC